VQSNGVLAIGGVISLLLGSLILLGGDTGAARISISVILTVTVATVAFFLVVVAAAVRAQRRKPETGEQGLLGETGTALTDLGPSGQVFVHGEYWAAQADEPITQGTRIVVDRVEGLVLKVRKA
jgi:membrane-bound serine protease (ClpP class)